MDRIRANNPLFLSRINELLMIIRNQLDTLYDMNRALGVNTNDNYIMFEFDPKDKANTRYKLVGARWQDMMKECKEGLRVEHYDALINYLESFVADLQSQITVAKLEAIQRDTQKIKEEILVEEKAEAKDDYEEEESKDEDPDDLQESKEEDEEDNVGELLDRLQKK